MKTERILFTRGDASTVPGGIILRARDEAPRYLVHHFNREPGSSEPVSFFWGSYHDSYAEAVEAFCDKRDRARRYTAGGSLIQADSARDEIAAEA